MIHGKMNLNFIRCINIDKVFNHKTTTIIKNM